MQQSSGLLLAAGWTAATPLFFPQEKMKIDPGHHCCPPNPKGVAVLFCNKGTGSNPFECNSPVDCCLPPAGRRQLLYFFRRKK